MNDCWWNDTDIGKPKYFETQTRSCPNVPVSTKQNGLELNTELRSEMFVTQSGLSHYCRPLYSAYYVNRKEQEDLSDDEFLFYSISVDSAAIH